jgi:mono/diheme cytochrome c family protein
MTRFDRISATALAMLALVVGGAAWAQNTAGGDAANGKRVYVAIGCYTCHGRSGQGGAMNYPAPILAQTQLPVETFKVFVRIGPNDMPAYSESQLSDKDLADIHAFLRSLPGRRAVRDIPLLNQ